MNNGTLLPVLGPKFHIRKFDSCQQSIFFFVNGKFRNASNMIFYPHSNIMKPFYKLTNKVFKMTVKQPTSMCTF